MDFNIDSQKLVWIAFALIFGIIVLKFIYWKIGRSMQELQRMAEDPDFRREKIAQIGAFLEQHPNDTEARLRRADLYRREGDFVKAASDLRLYLEGKPADAEGWAELAECAILLHEKHDALNAAQKARALDPEYADYSALCLRAHLLLGNLEAAQKDWERWADLDRQRCARPEPQRTWFSSQLPPGEVVTDPALTVYAAELLLRRGERDAARVRLEQLRAENPDYLADLFALDPLLKDLSLL